MSGIQWKCGGCGELYAEHRAAVMCCEQEQAPPPASAPRTVALSRGLMRERSQVHPLVRSLEIPAEAFEMKTLTRAEIIAKAQEQYESHHAHSDLHAKLIQALNKAAEPPQNNYRIAVRSTTGELIGNQDAVRAAQALARGLCALMGPRCARCEKPLHLVKDWRPDQYKLCTPCWEHIHRTGEDEWMPTMVVAQGQPSLLPRPGAIVLCVDDPNGDDVAEG